MKIHEYQGKEIFKSYGIPIQDGHIFEKIEDAQSIIDKVQKEFKTEAVVVKAQIHAGGRGKGGGVKFSPTAEAALERPRALIIAAPLFPTQGMNSSLSQSWSDITSVAD